MFSVGVLIHLNPYWLLSDKYYRHVRIQIGGDWNVVYEKGFFIICKAVVLLKIFKVRRVAAFNRIALDDISGKSLLQCVLLLTDRTLSGCIYSKEKQSSNTYKKSQKFYLLEIEKNPLL